MDMPVSLEWFVLAGLSEYEARARLEECKASQIVYVKDIHDLEHPLLVPGSLEESKLLLCGQGLRKDACTVVVTGKHAVSQEFQSCTTCGTDTQPFTCCMNCAEHCHAGHDLTPRKKDGGYCDCGDGVLPIANCQLDATWRNVKCDRDWCFHCSEKPVEEVWSSNGASTTLLMLQKRPDTDFYRLSPEIMWLICTELGHIGFDVSVSAVMKDVYALGDALAVMGDPDLARIADALQSCLTPIQTRPTNKAEVMVMQEFLNSSEIVTALDSNPWGASIHIRQMMNGALETLKWGYDMTGTAEPESPAP